MEVDGLLRFLVCGRFDGTPMRWKTSFASWLCGHSQAIQLDFHVLMKQRHTREHFFSLYKR